MVLEDKTHHFNELLHDIKELLRESAEIRIGSGEQKKMDHSVDFTDREGNETKMKLFIVFKETDTPKHGASAEVSFEYQGNDYSFSYFAPNKKDLEFSEDIGKIRLDTKLKCYSSYKYELDYSIWRTDVWAGMYKE